jgi:spermidine/putrescine ABC transporter ATP-binding subunit
MVDNPPPVSVSPQHSSLSSTHTIHVSGLVRRHGRVTAVDHVSFSVRRGEFFSILGPSGAGKTSVLRMLAGFEQPDEGELFIDGRSMVGVPPNRRPVNLVFQSYALFPHLTVFDNVAFGLRMRGVGRREIGDSVRAALDMVRLQGKDERLPSQLSGGEQQRVALARALVNKPAVVLLDEPLAALDQQLRQEMQVELKAIQERAGLTCVCVTHHQEEAMMMSDRIAVMHQGRMPQIGTPREVYARPATLFVARFLGASNELSGTVTGSESSGWWFEAANEGLPPFRLTNGAGDLRPGPAVLCLRPEDVRLSRLRESDHDNVLAGRIEKLLFAGTVSKCLVRVGSGHRWELPIVAAQEEEKPFAPGEALFVQWSSSAARIFAQ